MTYNEGDLVRIKDSGFIGVLEDINPRKDFDLEDECWAYVRDDDWSVRDIDGPDEIELVLSAEDASKRSVPTPKELLSAIDFLGGWAEDIRLNESEIDGDSAILLYGKTEFGINFAARLVVESIERA